MIRLQRRFGSLSRPLPGRQHYAPSIDPAVFVATVDNPLWPLKPGTGFHYKGTRGKTQQTDEILERVVKGHHEACRLVSVTH